MKKKTMENLDDINPLWLLKRISLGNLVRGVNWVTLIFRPVKKCMVSFIGKIKESVEELQQEGQAKTKDKKVASLSNKPIEGVEKAR